MEQAASGRDTVSILGVAVDRVDMSSAASRISEMIAAHREAAASGAPLPPVGHVITANTEMVMMARGNPALAEVFAAASLVVPDGIGLVWAAGVFGDPLPERVAGIDLMEEVLAACTRHGWRPFLLGAAPGVAEEAGRLLQRRYPDLEMAGWHHGYFEPGQTADILACIEASEADLLLVALGAPRQEEWIAAHRRLLRVPVAIGVGGSLDVWAGHAPRAPRWWREAGLEWLYRLLRQPRRAVRMLALPRFAATVFWTRWQKRGKMIV